MLPFGCSRSDAADLGLAGLSVAMLIAGDRAHAGPADGPLDDDPSRRSVLAVRLRAQARPGRAAAAPAVRDRLALAGPTRCAVGGPARSGAIVKIQPGLILVWALLTRRWIGGRRRRVVLLGGRASSRRSLLGGRRRLGGLRRAAPERQRPDHDAPQLHAGRGRVPGGRAGRRRDRDPARRAPCSSWSSSSSRSPWTRAGCVAPRDDRRHAAPVAGPLGPLRDAPAAAGRVAARAAPVVGRR